MSPAETEDRGKQGNWREGLQVLWSPETRHLLVVEADDDGGGDGETPAS